MSGLQLGAWRTCYHGRGQLRRHRKLHGGNVPFVSFWRKLSVALGTYEPAQGSQANDLLPTDSCIEDAVSGAGSPVSSLFDPQERLDVDSRPSIRRTSSLWQRFFKASTTALDQSGLPHLLHLLRIPLR